MQNPAEEASLYSLLWRLHFCLRDGSNPRVYYQTSDAKPYSFSHTKEGQENELGSGQIGITHIGKKFSTIKVMPSINSSERFFRRFLITILYFYTIHTPGRCFIVEDICRHCQAKSLCQWCLSSVIKIQRDTQRERHKCMRGIINYHILRSICFFKYFSFPGILEFANFPLYFETK